MSVGRPLTNRANWRFRPVAVPRVPRLKVSSEAKLRSPSQFMSSAAYEVKAAIRGSVHTPILGLTESRHAPPDTRPVSPGVRPREHFVATDPNLLSIGTPNRTDTMGLRNASGQSRVLLSEWLCCGKTGSTFLVAGFVLSISTWVHATPSCSGTALSVPSGLREVPVGDLFPVVLSVSDALPRADGPVRALSFTAAEFSRMGPALAAPIGLDRLPPDLPVLVRGRGVNLESRSIRMPPGASLEFSKRLSIASAMPGVFRVPGVDEGRMVEAEEFPGQQPAYSPVERERQKELACTSAVYEAYETAARAAAQALRIAPWQAITGHLAAAGKFPVRSGESHFEVRRRLEQAYVAMLKGCTTAGAGTDAAAVVARLRIGAGTCTATRVGSRYLVTSRHCIFAADGRPLAGIAATNIHAELAAEPGELYPVCGVLTPSATLSEPLGLLPERDFVVLRTPDFRTPAPRITTAAAPEMRDGVREPTEIEVTGVWPGSAALGAGGPLDLVQYKGGYCVVFRKGANSGCFFHHCGTVAGTSGAPMLARDPSGLRRAAQGPMLLGLNAGETPNSGESSCDVRQFAPGGNVATIIPPEIVDALQ